MKRKVVLYIAMSLDGYLAGPDDDISFLSLANIPGEDFGYASLLAGIDTVIWGRRTFDKVLSFGDGVPHEGKKVYVISRSKTGNAGHAVFENDLSALINRLKQEEGKDIYCDGGGQIVSELLKARLIDKVIISIIPHLLGKGIRLFGDDLPETGLVFLRSVSFPSGLVQLWYDVKRQ